MQITRLSLANVRAVRLIDLDFSTADGEPRRRMVLLGANGAGKTTLLDAIAHAFQALDGSTDGLGAKVLGAGDVRDIPPSFDLPEAPRTGEIRVAATFLDRERRRLRLLRGSTPSSGDLVVRLGGTWSDLWEGGVSESSKAARKAPESSGTAPATSPPGAPAVSRTANAPEAAVQEQSALNLLRDLERHLLVRPQHRPRGSSLIEPDPFADAARTILQEARPPCVLLAADRGVLEFRDDLPVRDVLLFDPRKGCLSKDRARFASLAVRLALAWNNERNDPGGAAARMWKVLAKYFPELPKPVHVDGLMFWLRNRDGLVVPLTSLSDGERAILLIFAEVAFRAPEEGVILIDEIEQHLHPRWQRAVLEGLAALVPTAQIIVTSQSPYIAAAAPDDVLKIGDWDRDGA
jgi:predicted ATPase